MTTALDTTQIQQLVQAELRRSGPGILIRQLQDHLRWGAGSPEGVVTATPGVLYIRVDGAAGTMLYQKRTGSEKTGWVAIA